MEFQQKTIMITGGTGALGLAVVKRFLEAGANIAIPTRGFSSTDVLKKFNAEDANRVFLAPADLSSEADVVAFVEKACARFGSVDFLANIAGGYAGGNDIADVPLAEWEEMMSTNLKTTFLTCREVLKLMLAQDSGRIINVAAKPAITSGANKGPYSISKRGVIALTETIADEIQGTGVTANAIAPSIILTEGNKKAMPGADFSKWVTPEEIAGLMAFLCSPDARSINGNVIRIFGGV